MSVLAAAIRAVERAPLPDPVLRRGIDLLVGRTRRAMTGAGEREFAAAMSAYPIAVHPDAANRQHYALPPGFFELVLGPRRKYSCCLYETPRDTLGAAEDHALAKTAAHAGLCDRQRILELGCGWGSLSLYMAERYPAARILAVSNSQPQRHYIEAQAAARGLSNLRVVTADVSEFEPQGRFDRIVSVEMFEHLSNWQAMLRRMRTWLAPNGRVFLHVFSHRAHPYRFDHDDPADWIGQYFFTGGIMPSHGLIRHLDDDFAVEQEWRWNGVHYQRTALAWLARFDANRAAIDPILAEVYGREAGLWARRWRLFFLATAGLFGDAGGNEWGVSHYRLRPAIGE